MLDMLEEQYHYTCDIAGCDAKVVLRAPSVPQGWCAFNTYDGGPSEKTFEHRGHLCPEHKSKFHAELKKNVTKKAF